MSAAPNTISYISIGIAALAFLTSAITLWLTYFRQGSVTMPRPTQIYFGADGSRNTGLDGPPKIFLRSLLISDSRKGRIIESMYVSLQRGETWQTFNIWVYGDDKLNRGSGLHISDTGIVTNHHFLLPKGDPPYHFREGQYDLKVFAQILGDKLPVVLFSQRLAVSIAEAEILNGGKTGLYFDWAPNAAEYLSSLHHDTPRL